jgi:hypothetical protein
MAIRPVEVSWNVVSLMLRKVAIGDADLLVGLVALIGL